ncbi:MAG: DNA alkylation repair protein [Candidatus Thermoplasmatota archaeon]|nr:DNA alkylation repair protein [Candidatus Thermoplasmatota archaeon]
MQFEQIIQKLQSLSNPDAACGMARYGINPQNNLGISVYQLRMIAKEIGTDHGLALQLWASEIHDARLLACFIEDPHQVTETQMDDWASAFDSWDICDQACTSLFDQSIFAYIKVHQWSTRDEEFVKRGAFALIAGLAVHDRTANDDDFEQFFPLIKTGATDNRNYVKKAVNWALRNIGKRNQLLNTRAIQTAYEIQHIPASSARWIATDALRELTSEKVQQRLCVKKKKKVR